MTDAIILGALIACSGRGGMGADYCLKVMRRENPKTMEQVLDARELAESEWLISERESSCELLMIDAARFEYRQTYGPPDPRDPCKEQAKESRKLARLLWKKAKRK